METDTQDVSMGTDNSTSPSEYQAVPDRHTRNAPSRAVVHASTQTDERAPAPAPVPTSAPSGPFDDLDKYDQHGHTPLFRAVRGYDREEVERLLRLGSDPSLPCPDGYTPLMLAVSAKIDYMPITEPAQTDLELLDLMLSFDTVVATINDKHRKYGTALAIALFRQLGRLSARRRERNNW
jgi:hypothetical protein